METGTEGVVVLEGRIDDLKEAQGVLGGAGISAEIVRPDDCNINS
jgi:hypothetical protein